MPNNIDPTSSWEHVIACSHPTQPTRYYRGYVLHYPTSSEAAVTALAQDSLATWSANTGVTLTVQYPLLPLTDHLTLELSASSLDFDNLLRFDTEFRAEIQHLPEGQLEPATMQLLDALSQTTHDQGNESPVTTLEVIEGLQAPAFDLNF